MTYKSITMSHSYISDEGQGNLKLRSNNFRFTNTGETKTSATFVPAGSVDLYFDNSKKLETTNGGVLVTGILTATSFVGDLTGDVTGNVTGNLVGDVTGTATTATNGRYKPLDHSWCKF